MRVRRVSSEFGLINHRRFCIVAVSQHSIARASHTQALIQSTVPMILLLK